MKTIYCSCVVLILWIANDPQIVDVKDGLEIGKISKQWPGLMKEMFTDSDNFRVTCKFNLCTDQRRGGSGQFRVTSNTYKLICIVLLIRDALTLITSVTC